MRPNPTAMPNVAPKTAASTSANLISGPRASGSVLSAASPLRRWRHPMTPSTHNATNLPITNHPYSERTSSGSWIRTSAFTTPLAAIATKHHNASAENRRAASSAWSPERIAWASNASRPPAHRAPAMRWTSKLLVARSCAPPADE